MKRKQESPIEDEVGKYSNKHKMIAIPRDSIIHDRISIHDIFDHTRTSHARQAGGAEGRTLSNDEDEII